MVAFTVLFGALLPAIAATTRGPDGDSWLEICTAYGIERVVFAAGSSDDEPAQLEQACDWCRLQGEVPAILLQSAKHCVPLARSASCVVPVRTVLPPHFVDWQPASPRAPPAHS